MPDCVFCKIVSKESPADFVYEDDAVVVIQDHRPVAPTHLLIIPRQHIPSLNDISEADNELLAHLLLTAKKVARLELGENPAYRTVINTGSAAGQTVFHLHVHVISGWPSVADLLTRGLR